MITLFGDTFSKQGFKPENTPLAIVLAFKANAI